MDGPIRDWSFFIDVGGTFTDVVACGPDQSLRTQKLLSSGVVRGVAGPGSTTTCVVDAGRAGEADDLWAGYSLALYPEGSASRATAGVAQFDSKTGQIVLESPLFDSLENVAIEGCPYELHGDEEAPIVAVRQMLGLRRSDPIGSISIRLGTTRATNALLERSGAKVALVTTAGFADLLRIGYQDRPDLFALHIKKRDELSHRAIEIDERMAASGDVLQPPDVENVRTLLAEARDHGIDALAICFMHAHVNAAHEESVAAIASDMDFRHVSVSSRVSRLQRMVPRADTTVVDAYLSPVIRDYVAALKRSAPEARIQLMTSHGGLRDAESVEGKDTVLSGPAGGVVGCSFVSKRGGYEQSIAFDMGGTSTDVARIEPSPNEFEYTEETVKDGVRMMTPMLSVETVAAGGGSICFFDGQKLTVGPQSAGADPGPACYGRGGPLTVTDMNLVLGRLVPAHFPFRLDRDAVDTQLGALAHRLKEEGPSRKAMQPFEIAEGFVEIANAKMAAAIKNISLARGFDVRNYVLTTFGGAGAQHACAIARQLGMSQVLCSPFAGVLSALGIGVAPIKRIGHRSVCVAVDDEWTSNLASVFEEIEEDLVRQLVIEGVGRDALDAPKRSLDVRYVGQSAHLTIALQPVEDCRQRFEQMHRQQYGYAHQGRSIEICAVRVECSVSSKFASSQELAVANQPLRMGIEGGRVSSTTKMVMDGAVRDVPLYARCDVSAGQAVKGPAIVIDDTCTIVIDPGWSALLNEYGDLLLTDSQSSHSRRTVSTDSDPVQLELFTNQFKAIADQMGATLRRTSLSVNVKERLDYSCAIFSPDGNLVVNAPHIPVHLGGMSDCVKALIEDVTTLNPGDTYLTNDPFRGGSHLNDVTVITPVHDAIDHTLQFIVASRAHHAEIGGSRPGSMPPDSTSLDQEGVLIRAFLWMKDGQPQVDALRALLVSGTFPSRTPDDNLADIAAQIAANQTGVQELQAMVRRSGLDVVHGYVRQLRDAAESKMRTALKAIPNGVRTFEDRLDDGATIRLKMTIDDDSVTLDFGGTDPVLSGNLNANHAIVTSATLYCLRCLLHEDLPLNAGVLAPVEIRLPECFLNPPANQDPGQCAAMVGGNVETSQRIVDCILGALGIVAASQGTMNNLLMGNSDLGYYETICGGAGAGPGFHGADAVHTHMTNTRLTDPEVLESRLPVRLNRFQIRRESGGQGEFSGGCGVLREIEFLEPLEVSILSQRRATQPYGANGGAPGLAGRNRIRRSGSSDFEELDSIAQWDANPGDRLIIESPGGGGWGAVG